MWTDPTDGPIRFVVHHASDNLLAVGSGADVVLARYQMGNSKASWMTKLAAPHPTRRPVAGDQVSVSTARARSAHFLKHKAHLVVAYVDRGVVYASLSIPLPHLRRTSSSCWDTGNLSAVWEITPRGGQMYVFSATVDRILIRGSGGSAISPDERLIALSNLAGGLECYTLDDQQRVHTIKLGTSESVPISILFDPDGSMVFGGSSGAAYIANGTPPTIKQSLKYGGECFL